MRTITDCTQTNSLADQTPKGITIGRRIRCLLAVALLFLPIRTAPAQTTWTGGGTNNNWSTSQNWTPIAAPTNNGTANVIMDGNVRLTPNVDMPWSINSLTFSNAASPFTIDGSTLTIGAGGIANQGVSVQTLNVPVVLNANQTWNTGGQDGAHLLAFGPVNTSGHSLTFIGGSSNSGGGLLNGGVSGNGSLIVAMSDSSSLASYGTNSYTGGTFLNSGRLFIDGDSSLGAPGSPLAFNGGTLGTGDAFTINRNITLGPAGGTIGNSVPQGSFVTLSSTIHGPGSLTISGGNLKLSGANSYSGGTFVNGSQVVGTTNSLQGNVSLNGVTNTVLEFDQDFHGTYAGSIRGGGGNVIVSGTGIVAFTGNNTYSADTLLGAGVLEVGAAGGGLSPFSRLIFGTNGGPLSSDGPILQVVGGGSFTRDLSQVLWNSPGGFAARNGDLAVNIGGNSGQISLDPFGSQTHWLVFGSPSANSVTDFQNPIYLGPNANTSPAPIVEVREGAGGDYTVLSGVISGGNSLNKIGNGRLVLSATNINSGPVRILGGILSVNTLANGGVPSGIGQSSNAATNLTFDNGGILQYTGPSVATDRGFTLNTGGGGFDVQAGTTLTVSGDSVGTGRLIKDGAGMLVLTGTNTYTGTTRVNAGTLLINGNQGGSTGAVNVVVAGRLGGNGIVGGATTIFGDLAPGNSAGTLTFLNGLTLDSNSTLTWELNANTDTLALRGALFDGVNVNGGLLINSASNSSLVFNTAGSTVNFADPFWQLNHSWLVFDNFLPYSGSHFGAVNVSNDSLAQSSSTLTGTFSWATIGGDVFLNYAIPEPTSWTLVVLGIIGAGLRFRGFSRPNR